MGTRARHEGPRPSPREGLLVADVMVRDVVAISPQTPIHQAARLMLERAVPGLPVVDSQGSVIGVLGEHDLLGRLGPMRSRPWWHLLVDAEQLALEYRKAVGDTVAEVMTHPAVTVSPADLVETVLRMFDDEAVDVVPVVLGRRMVGAVSRPVLTGGEVEKAALITMAHSVPGCHAIEDRIVAKTAAYRYHEMV
jgi:CBS-domain-containing membrane protein